MAQPFIHIRTNVGKAIHINGNTIVPIARSVHIQLPLLPGGLIWNRPTAILVRQSDGTEYTLPVHDVTRRLQVLVMIVGVLGTLFFWLARRGKR
ncbi:MAG: hypothetical protein ACUVSF_04995 [Anaerolineae bacterium]